MALRPTVSAVSQTTFRFPQPFQRAPLQWAYPGLYPFLSQCPRQVCLGQHGRVFVYQTGIDSRCFCSIVSWSWGFGALVSPISRWFWAGHGCLMLISWRYFFSGWCRTVPSTVCVPELPWSPVIRVYLNSFWMISVNPTFWFEMCLDLDSSGR